MSHPYVEFERGRKKITMERNRLTFGRQADCDVVLEDTQASRNHCVIERAGKDFVLRDLDSRNGTRLNGQLITSVVLAPKDVISVGATNMIFHVPADSFDKVDVLSA